MRWRTAPNGWRALIVPKICAPSENVHGVSFYDPNGNRTAVIDGLGHATSYSYDQRNRLTAVTEPSGGGTTSYSYDNHSRLLSITDPVGNTTSYQYDYAYAFCSPCRLK